MLYPSQITKESLTTILFVSGSNLHPSVTHYKYYWWIFSIESKCETANDVFFKRQYRLTTKQFMKKYDELISKNIPFAYLNIKQYRKGSIWNYEKIKKEDPQITFAPSYEDDTDDKWKEYK